MNIEEAVPTYGIKKNHLRRKAILYVRQSTSKQVIENIGPTQYQRSLVDHLLKTGWQRNIIEIVEDDLGRSGKSATGRPGYRRIVGEVEAGDVGIIAMSNVERGGREAIAWFVLFNLCRDHDVLVSIDCRIHDMRDRNNRTMLHLAAVLAENDSEMRTENFMRGRVAKARMGAFVSPVPTGYVRQRDGSLVLDSTPGVTEAIQTVFVTYLREGSIDRTVKALRANGVRVPGRRLGEEVEWPLASRGNVRRILINPIYSGAYHYGRTRLDPVLGFMECGAPRWRRTAPEEQIITLNHHSPLVSREDFTRVLEMRARNTIRRGGRSLGSNDTPLHGLAVCAIHGWRLGTHYARLRSDGTRQHFYLCSGNLNAGEKGCQFLRGRALDSVVQVAFFQRLEAPRLDELRLAVKRLTDGALAERFLQQSEENRLRQRVASLKYRYEKIDPDNRLVAAECEKELEDALRELQRSLHSPVEETPIDGERILEEALVFTGDLPALFNATTTMATERKELLRLLVARVVVGPSTRERTPMRIEWVDGIAPLECEVPLLGFCERRALELRLAGETHPRIAFIMNSEGLRTRNDTLWTAPAVSQAVRRARLLEDIPRE